MTKVYGLIGNPLSHSFSKKYFDAKFLKEGLADHDYNLFEISSINYLRVILDNNPGLAGLNVTIPYKESVIPFLDKLEESAKLVGAVNVIKIENGSLTGYNSDFYGFESSLLNWLPQNIIGLSALILGSGGGSKAVQAVLKANEIPFKVVSRNKTLDAYTYNELKTNSLITNNHLLINTTPIGMAPKIEACPDIPYEQLNKHHHVFDLIYNPSQSLFLEKALAKKASVKNGLEMLQLQAEKSWEIWTS